MVNWCSRPRLERYSSVVEKYRSGLMQAGSRDTMLDIDVGNTRIKWRLLADQTLHHGAYPLAESDAYQAWPKATPARVRISSVAPRARNLALTGFLEDRFRVAPEFAKTTSEAGGVKCGYVDPARLGVDRWLALLGARPLVQGAYVVADLGTAATVDFVDETSK